jgi:hypothetical protein
MLKPGATREPSEQPITNEWLAEALTRLRWNPTDWIRARFDIVADDVFQAVSMMNDAQKEDFAAEIRSQLRSRGCRG